VILAQFGRFLPNFGSVLPSWEGALSQSRGTPLHLRGVPAPFRGSLPSLREFPPRLGVPCPAGCCVGAMLAVPCWGGGPPGPPALLPGGFPSFPRGLDVRRPVIHAGAGTRDAPGHARTRQDTPGHTLGGLSSTSGGALGDRGDTAGSCPHIPAR